ncbi:alpha/beta hydrolase (plasmid) [Azospirillum sp. B510]|uniref:alpha/beta hydrolase n=1 Tax=Azospirillum sp. (strain B510) TaxID=137722 RepID=UPI0001C4B7F1|nr:alpha/beta fold hydrolase [Azospirillum sp. B510]BAI74570.1 alpha/beta hydrolase [Azospirillum sp. B510]
MTADRTIFLQGAGIGRHRPGVLLIHGLGGTPVELKTLGRRLQDAGLTVLCCQLAGHCGTAEELTATGWRDWYASVEAGLNRLETVCDSVSVGGLSMGALLAARLAWAEPQRVRSLVMLAPTLWYDGWAIPFYSFLLKFVIHLPFGRRYSFVERDPYGVKDPRIRALVLRAMQSGDASGAGLLSTPATAIREIWRLTAELRPLLPDVRQPTLLVHAREDDTAGLSNAFHLQARLGGRVEALILEDSYHLVTVDRQRDLVARRVAEFLATLAAGPDASVQPLRSEGAAP